MSLKTKNMPLLVAFLLGQAALFAIVLGHSPSPFLQDWKGSGVAASLAVIAVYVLSELLSDTAKARLVFWKWSNPLPGCAAFSEHMRADDRVDPALLERKHGPLPTDAAEQNRLWYNGIFKVHRDKPHLRQSHGRYLLLRELAALSFVLGALLGPAALALSSMPPPMKAGYIAVLVAQYLMIALAAANAGARMVRNALAEESA